MPFDVNVFLTCSSCMMCCIKLVDRNLIRGSVRLVSSGISYVTPKTAQSSLSTSIAIIFANLQNTTGLGDAKYYDDEKTRKVTGDFSSNNISNNISKNGGVVHSHYRGFKFSLFTSKIPFGFENNTRSVLVSSGYRKIKFVPLVYPKNHYKRKKVISRARDIANEFSDTASNSEIVAAANDDDRDNPGSLILRSPFIVAVAPESSVGKPVAPSDTTSTVSKRPRYLFRSLLNVNGIRRSKVSQKKLRADTKSEKKLYSKNYYDGQLERAGFDSKHFTSTRFRRQTVSRENDSISEISRIVATTNATNIDTTFTKPPHIGFPNNQSGHQMTTHEPSMEAVGSHIIVLIVLLAAVLTTVGLLTCVVTHYHHNHYHHHRHRQSETQQTTDCSPASAHLIWNQLYYNQANPGKKLNKLSSTTVPMLALEANMDRERRSLRDRQVRSHSVHTDIVLDLPTSVRLPDGEETPHGSSTWLRIRDEEQQSEIYNKCIRPPPNRTIEQSDPKPCRSSSTGLLSHSNNDWTQNVVRSHSMSNSRFNASIHIPPPVILPPQMSRSHNRQVSAGLAQITMVPCLTDRRSSSNAMNVNKHSSYHQSSGVSANTLLSSSNRNESSSSTTATGTTSTSTSTITMSSSMGVASRIPTTVATAVTSAVTILPTTRQI